MDDQTMLAKPDLPDDRLNSCLHEDYGLRILKLSFLPLGADVNTAVYCAVSEDATSYFVKLRHGDVDRATVLVPQLLSDLGIAQIIAPIATKTGQPWTKVDGFTVALYPFITGENGFDLHLADQQWAGLGVALKQMHTTVPPHDFTAQLPRETYSSHWREQVRTFQARVEEEVFDDPVAAQLATLLRANSDTVSELVSRGGQLGETLRGRSLEGVLCHGDIHAGNVLIDEDLALYIVDWDTLSIAPKERDLMFIGAGIGGVWNSAREQALFYQGYGRTEIDSMATAYYRYERIVQDIAAYCEQLLLSDEGGDDREQSLHYFASQFLPAGVVEIAFRSDPLPGRR
jgi:spectinomycin phosphotransferase